MTDYYLYITEPLLLEAALALAKFSNKLIVVDKVPESEMPYLQLDGNGLAVAGIFSKPYYVAEIYSKLNLRYQSLANDLLIQATKINTRVGDTLWDLTAGLGKDAIILASYGYDVTMVECNPLLATIIYYALNNKIIPSNSLNIVCTDSLQFVQQATTLPDIIYLDPMFNDEKTALAKKDMQLIQRLANNSKTDVKQLFAHSYNIIKTKVVVKRDNKQEKIVAAPPPSYTKQGKTVRFDVYRKN